jgi:peptide-methionine (S)-S-oxide reductase
LGVVTWLLLFVGQPLFVQSQTEAMENKESLSSIALGAGCFWCVEAVFEQLEGVQSAVSGYMGGHIKNPGYREVCTGRTGHAEVVLVTFDGAQIALGDILEVFFATHDPTTLNRQGADVGTQYRSAIFYASEEQKAMADAALQKAQLGFDVGIVTEITPATVFTKPKTTTKHTTNSTVKRRTAGLSSPRKCRNSESSSSRCSRCINHSDSASLIN